MKAGTVVLMLIKLPKTLTLLQLNKGTFIPFHGHSLLQLPVTT